MRAPDDDPEAQSVEALDLVTQAFRAAEKKLVDEVADYRPIEFFRVLVFATPAQGQAFATAVGEDVHTQYMDGRKICDRLGIEIPADVFKPKRSLLTPNKRLAALAMPLPARKGNT